MSNSRFFWHLTKAFLALLFLGIRQVPQGEPLGGYVIGFLVIPTLFILSLMVGVLCGLRKPGLKNGIQEDIEECSAG